MRDLHLKFDIEAPMSLMDPSGRNPRLHLLEEVQEWLDVNCGAWQHLGWQTVWFEYEKDRLHFKLRWLDN